MKIASVASKIFVLSLAVDVLSFQSLRMSQRRYLAGAQLYVMLKLDVRRHQHAGH